MWHKYRHHILLVLAAVALPAMPARADLVVNGGFEDPLVIFGGWQEFPAINGWARAFGDNFEIQGSAVGSPYAGGQHLELDADSENGEANKNTGIYQDLTTIPGAVYTLRFAWSPRPGWGESSMDVYWGGNFVGNLSANGLALADTNWQVQAYLLPATNSITRLQFNAAGISDGKGEYLDAVSVDEQLSEEVVPEPGTAALLIGGAALLLFGRGGRRLRRG
ncbi:MAG: hypothetical protein HYZ57_03015 [Acidobacteria bacterium]|nr:hypothetical protein [Acidobacteriota bacterium]MBI3278794.1 hypothetical protein [Acidobacteriota bacterium]